MNNFHTLSRCFTLLLFGVASIAWAESDLKLPPKDRDVPLAITSQQNLSKTDSGIGLSAGAKVPDFNVRAHNGEPINLEGLLEEAPLLIVFYRGGWCPYCNVQIRQLTQAYPEFKKRNVFPVLISVDNAEGATLANSSYDIPFAVLSDPKLSAHTAFKVILGVDDKTVERYKTMGIDLEQWSGESHHSIAIASAFLVDKKGIVRWSHASKDFRTRPSPEQLLAVIDTIEWD